MRARGTRRTTPCGTGVMVWHEWGEGPTVVLLHGGYGSWTHWIRNIDALAAEHRVVAADLPGLGDSAMPAEPFTPWSLAGILADGLDEMRVKPPFHLVGFSFGALLAGPLAVILAGRVATLTLVAASGLGMRRPPIALKPWRQLDDADQRAAVHAENLARLMFSDRTRIDDLAIDLQAHNTARARIKSPSALSRSANSSARSACPAASQVRATRAPCSADSRAASGKSASPSSARPSSPSPRSR